MERSVLTFVRNIRYWHVLGVGAGVAVAITMAIAPELNGTEAMRYLVGAWLVLPPLIFWCEYHLVRRYDPENLETMRTSQELARNIWAGIAAALGVLYLKGS
jgi:hypothetical protein